MQNRNAKSFAHEQNTVPRQRLELGPFDLDSIALTIKPPRLPRWINNVVTIRKKQTLVSVDTIHNWNID